MQPFGLKKKWEMYISAFLLIEESLHIIKIVSPAEAVIWVQLCLAIILGFEIF